MCFLFFAVEFVNVCVRATVQVLRECWRDQFHCSVITPPRVRESGLLSMDVQMRLAVYSVECVYFAKTSGAFWSPIWFLELLV